MTTRPCHDCLVEKPLEAYPRDKNRALGRGYICKACAVLRTRAWYANNKDRSLATGKRWRKANPEKHRASHRAFYARNAVRIRAATNAKRAADPTQRSRAHWAWIKRKYGLTKEQWLAIFDAQGERCAICRAQEPKSAHGWHTDHDHKTGEVRGILCHLCNRMLGFARDEPARLRAGASYLERTSC